MKKSLIGTLKAVALPAIVYLIFLAISFQRFGNFQCLYIILLQSIMPAIMGYSVSLGFMCGMFDFTIGSRIVIAASVGGMLSTSFGLWGLVIGCFIVSIVLGLFTGVVNRVLRIPSMILTIGLAMIYEIAGYIIGLFGLAESGFISLNREHTVLGNPLYSIIILVIAAIAFHLIIHRTKLSFNIRAVGSNEKIAQNAGVNVHRTKIMTFFIGSVFLAVVSILEISSSGSVSAKVNLESAWLLFKPLMGVLVARALLSVCNFTVGIFIGSFTINVLFIGLLAAGVKDVYQNVALGVFLLFVMFVSENKDGIKARFGKKFNLAEVQKR